MDFKLTDQLKIESDKFDKMSIMEAVRLIALM